MSFPGLKTDDSLAQFRNRFKKDLSAAKSSAPKVPNRYLVKANDASAQMSGYLHRKSVKTHKWKRLWFVLKDRVLYVYKAAEDTVAYETHSILGFTIDFLDPEVGI